MKAKDMIPGKWYKVEIYKTIWIILFSRLDTKNIYTDKSVCKNNFYNNKDSNWGLINDVTSVKFATIEEILKYYPDEKFQTDNYLIY